MENNRLKYFISIAALAFNFGIVLGQNGPVYKAVLYNINGVELVSRAVQTKLTISQVSSPPVFVQTNSTTTDSLGILTLRFNDGVLTTGNQNSLKKLSYRTNNFFLKLEIDTTIGPSTGYHVYSNSLIAPSFFTYDAFYSDTSNVSRDNLFTKTGGVTRMKELGGIIISSVTKIQRDAMLTPPQGLMVYVTDLSDFSYYTGSQWVEIGTLQDLDQYKKEMRTKMALIFGQ